MALDSIAGLARVAAEQGADDEAAALCRELLAVWERSEDHQDQPEAELPEPDRHGGTNGNKQSDDREVIR